MILKRYNEFINESVNDKFALLDILRGYGVFNPAEFMKYINELGYTIVELDQVGRTIQESFDKFDKVFEDDDEVYDDFIEDEKYRLHNWLIRNGVEYPDSFFNELYDEFGLTIVKDSEWEPIDDDFVPANESLTNENIDMRDKLKRRINPTMFDKISKIGMIMMDVYTHGLRANLESIPGDEQYMHTMQYVYESLKAINLIKKLEKWTEKKKNNKELSSSELKEFDNFIRETIETFHYKYPRNFKGQLTSFEQDDMDKFVNEYNKLVDKYSGKKIYQVHNRNI